MNSNWLQNHSSNNQIVNYFSPADLEIWQMIEKYNRAPLLYTFKLRASFHSHLWIQTGIAVWKHSIWVKNHCNFEILWITSKINRAPLLCPFKRCASFCSHLWIHTGVREMLNSGQKCRFFSMYELQIWRMISINNIAPFLCPFKPCASFWSHLWIQPGVTVWITQFGSKS